MTPRRPTAQAWHDVRLPLRRVEARVTGEVPERRDDVWPFDIPAVAQLLREGLDLGPATVLVGENGAGKSTLVEGNAMAYGLNPEGGSTGAQHTTRPSESPLHQHLQLVRHAGSATRWGFFLRAETMHSFYTYVDGMFGEDFHGRSHGEGFLDLFTGHRFTDKFGLYVFDEPESALSFTSQLHLLAVLLGLMERGDSQVLLATHSPVLASLPGATLLQLDEDGYRPAAWEDLDLVDHYRRFLDGPERYLRHLR